MRKLIVTTFLTVDGRWLSTADSSGTWNRLAYYAAESVG